MFASAKVKTIRIKFFKDLRKTGILKKKFFFGMIVLDLLYDFLMFSRTFINLQILLYTCTNFRSLYSYLLENKYGKEERTNQRRTARRDIASFIL